MPPHPGICSKYVLRSHDDPFVFRVDRGMTPQTVNTRAVVAAKHARGIDARALHPRYGSGDFRPAKIHPTRHAKECVLAACA